MCDYSRRFPCSRLAEVGDKLITTSIRSVRGFAAADNCRLGICLQPGTELAFEKPVETLNLFGRWFSRWLSMTRSRSIRPRL
jgi:hypothetical protein